MGVRLVAIDLDDTLLDSKRQISRECSLAIRKVREKGVIVTLATGRMFKAALPYARELKLDIPLITYQGALVKHAFSGEVLYYKTIADDVAREVMMFLQANDAYYHIYCEDNLYVKEMTPEVDFYVATGIKPQVVGELTDFVNGQQVTEIMAVINEEKQFRRIEKELQVRFGRKLHINRFKDKYIEIMHKKATKADALEVIAAHYNIGRHEVMAIGDNYNDMPMIKWAGVGVAMGNAHEEIKQVADFVTLSNEEKGVAEALHKYILK